MARRTGFMLLVLITGFFFSGCTLYWEKGQLVRCPKCATTFAIDDIPGKERARE